MGKKDKEKGKGPGTKEPKEKARYDSRYTQNRDISWLRFDRRCMEEAGDPGVPLLERLRFLSIFTTNLDEFFMVRVGELNDMAQMVPEPVDNKTNKTASQILREVLTDVRPLIRLRDGYYRAVMGDLAQAGLRCLSCAALRPNQKKFVQKYYEQRIAPLLSPQIIDQRHPLPLLESKSLCLCASLTNKKGKEMLGLVQIPHMLPRYLPLQDEEGAFILMEEILKSRVTDLFPSYSVTDVRTFAVTRSADITYDDEKFEDYSDYRQNMRALLKKRTRLEPVRLEIQGKPDKVLAEQMGAYLKLSDRQIYFCDCPLDIRWAYGIESLLPKPKAAALLYPPYKPADPAWYRRGHVLEAVKRKDRMLFYPYESMSPFLEFLREAAEDPAVISISITIYRLATASRVANILCAAAENGKQVTAVMELRARFDEQNNISWSEQMEKAGCRIIYGPSGYKCHSKICVVKRRGRLGREEYYTQVGTGNYNEKTAVQYSDLCLMTADEEIGRDAEDFFRNMLLGALDKTYRALWVAPFTLHSSLMRKIDEQIALGSEGYIVIKANSLSERKVIDKLAEASRAGVRIRLILRGICCLRPGLDGDTENIEIRSIVGRYLEHARIYRFGRDDETCELYIASADLMTRNLLRRVEIACPIRDPDLRKRILRILEMQLRDDIKARQILSDGSFVPVSERRTFSCQEEAMRIASEESGSIRTRGNFFTWLRGLFRRKRNEAEEEKAVPAPADAAPAVIPPELLAEAEEELPETPPAPAAPAEDAALAEEADAAAEAEEEEKEPEETAEPGPAAAEAEAHDGGAEAETAADGDGTGPADHSGEEETGEEAEEEAEEEEEADRPDKP